MKVLISGVNPKQAGHTPRLAYISFIEAVVKGLQPNHQVELRPINLGEDLTQYDRVIIFLATMRGFLSVHTLGTLWGLYAGGAKVTIAFDDWQVPQAVGGIKSLAAQREEIIAKNPFNYRQIENFPQFKAQCWSALDTLIKDEWQWPVLIPAYAGGKTELFGIPKSKIFTCNPSVLFKGKYGWVDEKAPVQKNEQWILAALHDHSRWLKKQGAAWPVHQYGHKKQKQERIPEPGIYEKYKESWGVLSPAYKINGSGWWRARYGLAADALSVIVGDQTEMAMFNNEAYSLISKASIVEKLSSEERLELAVAQREAYYTAAGTVERLQADMAKALES
jgi:hypothetical protein